MHVFDGIDAQTPPGDDHLGDKDYLMVDKWALHNLHTRWRKRLDSRPSAVAGVHNGATTAKGRERVTSIYVDMGASTYNEGFGGASQSWFVDVASAFHLRRCTFLK
jgi:hypothetical protein